MSLGHGASIVRDGLTLHLDAANPKSYPGSGTSWFDLSNNKITATLVNGVTSDNESLIFDGTTQRVDTGQTASTLSGNGGNSFTLNSWVNKSVDAGPWDMIFGYVGFNRGLVFHDDQRFKMAHWYNMNTTPVPVQAIGTTVSEIGKWYNVTGTFNSNGNMELFVNGELESTVDVSGQTDWGNFVFQIGGTAGLSETYATLNGKISTAMFYNRILTPNEIKQNFEALKGRYGL